MKRAWMIFSLLVGPLACPAQRPAERAAPVEKKAAADPNVSTVSGFSAPSFDDENRMKSRVFGDFAKIMPNGYAEITGMRVEFYEYDKATSNRTTAMTVTSPQCVYQREKKAAISREDVRIERSDMVITGTGFVWENDQGLMQIHHNAKVVLKNARRSAGKGSIAP